MGEIYRYVGESLPPRHLLGRWCVETSKHVDPGTIIWNNDATTLVFDPGTVDELSHIPVIVISVDILISFWKML